VFATDASPSDADLDVTIMRDGRLIFYLDMQEMELKK
jgi:hypothetical protein